jgi:hypothetical protein
MLIVFFHQLPLALQTARSVDSSDGGIDHIQNANLILQPMELCLMSSRRCVSLLDCHSKFGLEGGLHGHHLLAHDLFEGVSKVFRCVLCAQLLELPHEIIIQRAQGGDL